jgi:hypothetical protein
MTRDDHRKDMVRRAREAISATVQMTLGTCTRATIASCDYAQGVFGAVHGTDRNRPATR